MKYYLIAGEASGDLHASHLMKWLKHYDKEATFRFFGGDLMAAQGGQCVCHYRHLAYMGFVSVALHLSTILKKMKMCRNDIMRWQPDVVILVDYPGFNLKIARFVHRHTSIPVYYYISPKIWAWKEYRIKAIKRDVDEMFSILPFEIPFYEEKHHYPIHYVGNPTMDEVRNFQATHPSANEAFDKRWGIEKECVIALLPGSRKQEINANFKPMVNAALTFKDNFQIAVAAMKDNHSFYNADSNEDLHFVDDATYSLLSRATMAVVTSGTATLETALFGVPQVVCYSTPMPRLVSLLRKWLLKVKYVSLVNLIAGREVVPELVANSFSEENIVKELKKIMPGTPGRKRMMEGYAEVKSRLGDKCAPENAAKLMVDLLQKKNKR